LAAALIFFSAFLASAAIPEGWSTNLAEAWPAARAHKQPVLVYFTADWCGPCQMMARTTLKDETTLQVLAHYQRVALDIDLNKAKAQEMGVGAVPSFIILNGEGDELDRAGGYLEPGLFRAWLASGMARHERAQAQQQKNLEQQKRLVAELQGDDPGKRAKALKAVFDLCARREQSQQKFAHEQLKNLATNEPAMLLLGLNHPSLATRIQVANLLREKWGEAFYFDPWDKAAVRAEALAELQRQFSAQK
jgi:thioredoxin-like negative regulator of GroEL